MEVQPLLHGNDTMLLQSDTNSMTPSLNISRKDVPILSVNNISSNFEGESDSDNDVMIFRHSGSKDDLLLPPLPHTTAEESDISRNSIIINIEDIAALDFNVPRIFPIKSHDTINNLSKALEISDSSFEIESPKINHRQHYRNTSASLSSSSSVIFNNNIFENHNTSTTSNGNASILDASSIISSSPKISSKLHKRFFSISSSWGNNGYNRRSKSTNNNNNNVRLNTITQNNTNSCSRDVIKSRSRSLSNSNIFRKLSFSNLSIRHHSNSVNEISEFPNTRLETSIRDKIEETFFNQSTDSVLSNKSNNLTIQSITNIDELKSFNKIDFDNDDKQDEYVQNLLSLQRQDDLKFEILLKNISKNKWYTQDEINELKLQRIKINDLWAKKINFY